MNDVSVWIYLLIMILTTNLIRILPVTIIRKKITNRFLKSFLYYVPYVTLAVMTFPAIMQATASPLAGLAALLFGILAAWFGLGLFPVSIICCVCVFILEFQPSKMTSDLDDYFDAVSSQYMDSVAVRRDGKTIYLRQNGYAIVEDPEGIYFTWNTTCQSREDLLGSSDAACSTSVPMTPCVSATSEELTAIEYENHRTVRQY